MLLVSHGRLDLRAAKKGNSVSALGDSYALGIAGTGGTSSAPFNEFSLRFLSVGNLEVDTLWTIRSGPIEVRAEV